MSPTQGKTILPLATFLGDTRSGPWLQRRIPTSALIYYPSDRTLSAPWHYREGTPAPCYTQGDPPRSSALKRGRCAPQRARRVPALSPAALLSERRQAEAGWGAVKRSRRWKPGLHPHCPRFRSRREPPEPDPTCARAGALGAAASWESAPTDQVSASGSSSSEKPEQVKEMVCPLPLQICGSRGCECPQVARQLQRES